MEEQNVYIVGNVESNMSSQIEAGLFKCLDLEAKFLPEIMLKYQVKYVNLIQFITKFPKDTTYNNHFS